MTKKKILILSIASTLLVSGVVFAQVSPENTSVNTNTRTQERMDELNAKKEAVKLKRCETVENNLSKKVNNFEKNKVKHVESYQKSYKKMAELVVRMEEDGYDVTKLRSDLATLDGMIKKFASDYALYTQTVKDSQQYACGESEGAFRVKLNETRTQLKGVKDQSVAIRTFWAKTFKQDLLEAKAQKTTDTTETTTEEAR